jgi:hypothetical protein
VSRRRSASSAAAVLALVFLFGAAAGAQTVNDEAQVKAAFVYNFLKFVEWPAGAFSSPAGAMVVGVVGEGDIAEATVRFLSTKQVGLRPLVVRRIAVGDPLTGVHALFVAEADARRERYVLDAAAVAPILSIGEGPAFVSAGGVIGLVIEQRRVRFDINVDAASATGLRVSSKLLALTRVVHSSARGRPATQ